MAAIVDCTVSAVHIADAYTPSMTQSSLSIIDQYTCKDSPSWESQCISTPRNHTAEGAALGQLLSCNYSWCMVIMLGTAAMDSHAHKEAPAQYQSWLATSTVATYGWQVHCDSRKAAWNSLSRSMRLWLFFRVNT